jgi:hypothetical protein
LSDCHNPQKFDVPGWLGSDPNRDLSEFEKQYKTCGILRVSPCLDFIFVGFCNISLVFNAFCDPYKFVILEALEGMEIMLRASFKNNLKPEEY